MKHKILPPLFAAGFSILHATSTPLRFSAPPVVARFPDGALEWSATVSCADPGALSSISIVFSTDSDLDGVSDGTRDSTLLSAANCDSGQVLHIARTFFPTQAAVLTAELKQGDVLLDHHSALTHGIGSLLSIHRFCARPVNSEPEWIEVSNLSPARIDLSRVRIEGHLLQGDLDPNSSLLVGRDSLDLQRWQPAARIFVASSWSYLRNTGDTLRLTWDNSVVLDSIIYGAISESHEACASAVSEENIAAATGYGMEISPVRWNPRAEPLVIKVTASGAGGYDLHAYDLDGFELCAMARNKKGSTEIQLSAADCRGLVNRSGSILLQLQPTGSAAAAPLRKRIRLLSPY